MIISLDCETQGLSGKMIECAIYKSEKRQYVCKSKEEVWTILLDLALKESKRGHNLMVYAHNMKFDFFKIVKWDLPGIKIKNDLPFIAEYSIAYEHSKKDDKKATILFLDTWGIYRRSLKSCAKLIGEEKLEISENLRQGTSSEELTEEERTYMIKDAEICLKLIKRIQEELKKYGTQVKTIMSIGQIAMNSFLTWTKANDYLEIFEDKFRNQLIKPKYGYKIHRAYRYGRVEITRTELPEGAYEVDINNLYSYSAMANPFPDLQSERLIKKPLDTLSQTGLKNLLNQYPIGTFKGILKTPPQEVPYGLLAIKTDEKLFFPREPNKYLIGNWANIEITEALKMGYSIIGCEHVITFNTAKRNPFEEYFKEIYKRRKSGGEFADFFWKQIANFTIAKFAQIRPKKEYVLDDIMKVNDYYKKGYTFVKSYKNNYLYVKEGKEEPSKQYHPIIPTMINAYAKLYHYSFLKKVPREDFIYCDTDNIIFKNEANLSLFPIGKEIGEFKLSQADKSFKSWNMKTYRIGDEIRASGVRKARTEEEKKEMIDDFDNGYIHYQRMRGIQKGKPLDMAGTFERVDVNLFESAENKIYKEAELKEKEIYIQSDDTFDMEYVSERIANERRHS